MANAAITVDLNARIAQFETELKRATGTLDRFEKKGSATLAAFKSFGAGLVGALSVGAITSFAKAGIDAADALNDMSQRTGVAVKTLAEYKLAATLADTSLDDLAKGIQRLTLSQGQAAQGGKAQAEALQRLGITARDPQQAFEQLADAVANSNDPTRIAVDLNALLGRSYVNLLPLLQGGSKALRESAAASADFSDAMVRLAPEAARLNDQLDALKLNAAGAASQLLVRLVPSLSETSSRVAELLSEDRGISALVRAIAGLGKIPFDLLIGDPFKIADSAPARIKELKAELGELNRDLKSAQPGGGKSSVVMRAIFGTPEEIKQQITVIKNQIEALEKFGDKIFKPRAEKKPDGSGGIFTPPTSSKAAAKSDPLAGLLGQTDIGRLAAFDKQVALLNARFDGGRKSTELYNQAMTRLVETTFAANFAQFTKDLAEQDETQRLVADHLKATNDELFEQQQAWTDAGRALEESMRTPLEDANIEFGRLQELLDRGVITWETYTRAVLKTQDAIDGTPEKLEELDTFAKKAAENIQDSFADFLFDPFDNGLKGMLQGFGDTLRRIIAEAAAADIAKSLFGDLVKGGSGSGFFGGALTKIGDLFGFANGGVMTSAGPLKLSSYATGGIASSPQLALFGEGSRPEAFVPLPDGRNIPVKMQGSGGGNTYIVNVSGGSAPDVRRAAAQGMREALGLFEGARRYG